MTTTKISNCPARLVQRFSKLFSIIPISREGKNDLKRGFNEAFHRFAQEEKSEMHYCPNHKYRKFES